MKISKTFECSLFLPRSHSLPPSLSLSLPSSLPPSLSLSCPPSPLSLPLPPSLPAALLSCIKFCYSPSPFPPLSPLRGEEILSLAQENSETESFRLHRKQKPKLNRSLRFDFFLPPPVSVRFGFWVYGTFLENLRFHQKNRENSPLECRRSSLKSQNERPLIQRSNGSFRALSRIT